MRAEPLVFQHNLHLSESRKIKHHPTAQSKHSTTMRASNTTTIVAVVERNLISAINDAVFSKSNWETSVEIRKSAAESIRAVVESWSTYPGLQKDSSNPYDTVDKLHFVYTAAQKLNCYRNSTNSLPGKIIACFTEQIKRTSTPTTGLINDILEAATKVQATQQMRIKAEQRDIARAVAGAVAQEKKSAEAEGDEVVVQMEWETSKKNKERSNGDGNMPAIGDAPSFDTSIPNKRIKMIAETNIAETAPPQDDEDAGVQDANIKNTALTTLPFSAPPQSKQTTSSPKVKNPRPGPGNFNRESYTKWYPDEEAFMEALIVANPTYTYQQYANANTARFQGTYYVDGDGRQHARMREGRTANSVALRYRVFRQGILKAARDAERPRLAERSPEPPGMDSVSGVATMVGEVSEDDKEGWSSDNQEASTESKDPGAREMTAWQAQGSTSRDGSSVLQGSGPGAGGGESSASAATGNSAPNRQANLSQPVRVFASGVMLAPYSGRAADVTTYPP